MYRYKYKYKYGSDLIRTKQTSTPLTIRITNKGGNYPFLFSAVYTVGGDSKEEKRRIVSRKTDNDYGPCRYNGYHTAHYSCYECS
jgi:hypothetical protein